MRKLAILLLLSVFIAIAFAKLVHPIEEIKKLTSQMKVKEAWQKAMSELHGAIQRMEKHTESNVRSLKEGRAFTSAPATSCISALENLAIVYNSTNCGAHISTFFSTTDSGVRATAVTNYCTNCLTDANNALRAVKQFCPILNRIDPGFRNGIYYNNFICSRDGNTFCAPGLLTLSATLANINPERLRAADLDPICTRCNLIAVRALTVAGTITVQQAFVSLRVLRGICFKIRGEYCAVKVTNDFEAMAPVLRKFETQQSPTADDMNLVMKAFCSPCLRLFFGRVFSVIGTARNPITEILGRLCRKKDRNTYCVVSIINDAPLALASVIGGQNPCTALPGTCTTQCKNVIQELVSKTGCCWGALADFAGVNVTAAALVFANCQINLPPICPSYYRAVVKYVLGNIDTTWIADSGNLAKLKQALAADIAATTTANVGNIDVVASKKRANAITVSASVETEPSAGDGVTQTEFECFSTCGLTDAVADPGAGGVTTESKTVTNEQIENSSSLISFSFALLMLFALLFLLF